MPVNRKAWIPAEGRRAMLLPILLLVLVFGGGGG